MTSSRLSPLISETIRMILGIKAEKDCEGLTKTRSEIARLFRFDPNLARLSRYIASPESGIDGQIPEAAVAQSLDLEMQYAIENTPHYFSAIFDNSMRSGSLCQHAFSGAAKVAKKKICPPFIPICLPSKVSNENAAAGSVKQLVLQRNGLTRVNVFVSESTSVSFIYWKNFPELEDPQLVMKNCFLARPSGLMGDDITDTPFQNLPKSVSMITLPLYMHDHMFLVRHAYFFKPFESMVSKRAREDVWGAVGVVLGADFMKAHPHVLYEADATCTTSDQPIMPGMNIFVSPDMFDQGTGPDLEIEKQGTILVCIDALFRDKTESAPAKAAYGVFFNGGSVYNFFGCLPSNSPIGDGEFGDGAPWPLFPLKHEPTSPLSQERAIIQGIIATLELIPTLFAMHSFDAVLLCLPDENLADKLAEDNLAQLERNDWKNTPKSKKMTSNSDLIRKLYLHSVPRMNKLGLEVQIIAVPKTCIEALAARELAVAGTTMTRCYFGDRGRTFKYDTAWVDTYAEEYEPEPLEKLLHKVRNGVERESQTKRELFKGKHYVSFAEDGGWMVLKKDVIYAMTEIAKLQRHIKFWVKVSDPMHLERLREQGILAERKRLAKEGLLPEEINKCVNHEHGGAKKQKKKKPKKKKKKQKSEKELDEDDFSIDPGDVLDGEAEGEDEDDEFVVPRESISKEGADPSKIPGPKNDSQPPTIIPKEPLTDPGIIESPSSVPPSSSVDTLSQGVVWSESNEVDLQEFMKIVKENPMDFEAAAKMAIGTKVEIDFEELLDRSPGLKEQLMDRLVEIGALKSQVGAGIGVAGSGSHRVKGGRNKWR